MRMVNKNIIAAVVMITPYRGAKISLYNMPRRIPSNKQKKKKYLFYVLDDNYL